MPQKPEDDIIEALSDARSQTRRANEQVRRANKAVAKLEELVLSRLGIGYERKERQDV